MPSPPQTDSFNRDLRRGWRQPCIPAINVLFELWSDYEFSKKAKAGLFLDPREALGLVASGTAVRALWIRRDPWPGKSEQVPCSLPGIPADLGGCADKCPCLIFVLCKERLNP